MRAAAPLLELAAVVIGLAFLARVAGRFGVPPIPLYLGAGLAFGEGGILPLITTREFVELGAEIGLILLLLSVGLEYSAAELVSTMRRSTRAGIVDLVLNYTPGLVAGLMLGWGLLPSMFLGGVTLVSSSSVAAKLIADHGWFGNRETPIVLSIAVIEDLFMALYLPLLAAILIAGSVPLGIASAIVAVLSVAAVLALAAKVEVGISRAIFSRSDEALLLTILGIALLIAGVATLLQVSAAVGALLAGILLSGPAAEEARPLLAPLRHLFAAIFFAFIGLTVDPASLPGFLLPAATLGIVTAATKFSTGWLAARWAGIGPRGRARAGTALIARGEFSIAIAAVGVGGNLHPSLGPLTVAYVILLAIAGPFLTTIAEPVAARLQTAPAPPSAAGGRGLAEREEGP